MNQDTQDFEPLRRLLALKRHEVPPPGYFNGFSSQVIARIKAGERGGEGAFLDRVLWEASWLRRVWAALEAKPILAGACSVAACGMLLAGMIYSDRAEVPPVGLVPVAESGSAPMAPTVMAAADHPLLVKPVALPETSSTSPIPSVPTGRLLVGDIGQLRAQRVNWSFPGGN
jgi:hypothetical protein